MTVERIFADLDEELALRIRAWLMLAEQASEAGDRWSVEIHKGRAEALHSFGLWMAEHFHLGEDAEARERFRRSVSLAAGIPIDPKVR